MGNGFKETAHLKTDLKKLHANWDSIDWNKKESFSVADHAIEFEEPCMAAGPSWSTGVWYKIECLDCGSNCDLLQDKHQRVICRKCLDKNEFNEGEDDPSKT